MPDPTLAVRTSVAWNKWLMVELEPLLASYFIQDEEGQE
jgi:hypothetical protein